MAAKTSVAAVASPPGQQQYQPPVHEDNALEFAQRRIVQLGALLFMTYGGAGEDFRSSNEMYQDNALWLAHDLAKEVQDALSAVNAQRLAVHS